MIKYEIISFTKDILKDMYYNVIKVNKIIFSH